MYLFASTDAATGLFYALILFVVPVLLISLAIWLFVVWIITLVHSIQHEDVPNRVVWIILHILVGTVIGPIYWYAVKKPYDKSNIQTLGKSKKK